MDAFYASVELLRYPELRGKPVVIGGGRRHQPVEYVDPVSHEAVRTFATLRGYAGRGVVTTATYEARAFGVHSAMGMMKAAVLAPDAVLLPVDFDAYRHHSRLFKAAVRSIAPHIEDRGIDEIYVDLTTLAADADAREHGDTRAAASGRDHVRTLAQSIKEQAEIKGLAEHISEVLVPTEEVVHDLLHDLDPRLPIEVGRRHRRCGCHAALRHGTRGPARVADRR